MLIVFRCFIVACLLGCTSLSQEVWNEYPDPPIDAADIAAAKEQPGLITRQNHSAARDLCLRLAAKYPGTSFGAQALFGAHYAEILSFEGEADPDATLRRIIAEYPNSRFEVRARYIQLQDLTWKGDRKAKRKNYSDFLADLGTPRLEDIYLGKDSEQALRRLESFHPGRRDALSSVYYAATFLADEKEEQIYIALFGRQAFGIFYPGNIDFGSLLHSILKEQTGKRVGVTTTRTKPAVSIISPQPGSVVETSPVIAVSMTAGDYRNSQITLEELSFKVDGVEQKLKTIVRSKIDPSLAENRDLEILNVSLTSNLGPGPHTVEVLVKTGQGPIVPENSTVQKWSFTVAEPATPTQSLQPLIPPPRPTAAPESR